MTMTDLAQEAPDEKDEPIAPRVSPEQYREMTTREAAEYEEQRRPGRGKKAVTGIDIYLQKIRIWTVQNNFNPHSLAKASNMSPGTLRFMWKQSWNPNVDTLRELEWFMQRYEAEKPKRRPPGDTDR